MRKLLDYLKSYFFWLLFEVLFRMIKVKKDVIKFMDEFLLKLYLLFFDQIIYYFADFRLEFL
jgi:hypothetical protein